MTDSKCIIIGACTGSTNRVDVLLVEDDEDDYLLTKELFDEAYGNNYSLTWSSTPNEAIEQLSSSTFDICMIDYRLGENTGIDLIKEINNQGHTEIPKILLTGIDSHEVDLKATEAGAIDYLVKNQLNAQILERSIRYARQQQVNESKVHHMAFHDPLTGIPNRLLFAKYLARSISTARRHEQYGALLFIDLDNFKSVNDSLGHSIGDEMIIIISNRLKGNIREGDIVARFGGDEFVLLLTLLSNDKKTAYEKTNKLAKSIQQKINEPMNISGHDLRIRCSTGITLFSSKATTSELLLQQADIAMYRAKNDGKNTIRFFESEMEESVNTTHWIEQELHIALENNHLELFYQPIIRFSTQKIIGAEALIRWRHPERGLIMPDSFIPISETSDFVFDIGNFVILTACTYIKKMPMLEYISINISARHFENDCFYNDIVSKLELMEVSPKRIVIELTESTVLKDTKLARKKMIELGELGIRFALDDFGTGFSSLSVLKDLPFHCLKVDRSFVKDIGSANRYDSITKAIIVMARILELKVIAEGVETLAQLEFLNKHECTFVQGYYFSPGVTGDDFIALLDLK